MTKRAYRIAAYTAAAVLAALIAAVLVAPAYVDWSRYRGDIAAAMRAAIGRDVVIAGDIGIEILPAPVLRLGDVRLANPDGFEGREMARTESVAMRISLLALVSGRIEVRALTFVRPVLALEILPDGRANWRFERLPRAAAEGAPLGGAIAFAGAEVDLTIEDATITFRDGRSGFEQAFEILDATIKAPTKEQAVRQAYRASGRLVYRGLAAAFEATIGPFASGEPAPIKMSLWRRQEGARLRFSGELGGPPGASVLSGALSGEGRDFLALASGLGGFDPATAPDWLAGEFGIGAELRIAGDAVEFNNLSLRLGEFRAAGAGQFKLTRPATADLALAVETINLDRLVAGPDTGPDGTARTTIAGLPEFTGNIADGLDQALTRALAFFGANRLNASLTLGTLIYNGRIARETLLDAEIGAGRIRINRFASRLPGATEISLSGLVTAEDGGPRFEGTVDGQAGNLRGVLRWLGIDVSAVPPDRLRKAALSSRVVATPDRLRFEKASLDLDVSHIEGRLSVGFGPKRRYDIAATADRFDIDAYLPRPVIGAADDYDLILVARVGRLGFRGTMLDDARVDLALEDGVLTLRDVGFGGPDTVRASLSGSVSGLGIAPEFDLSVDLDAPSASAAWALAGGRPPGWTARLGPLVVRARLAGQLASAELRLDAETAGGHLTLDGGVRLSLKGPRYDFDLVASHPDMAALGRLLDPRFGQGSAVLTGGARITATVSGDLAGARVSGFTAILGPSEARGSATIDFSGPRPRLVGRLTTGPLDFGLLFQDPVAAVARGGAAAPARGERSGPTAADGGKRERRRDFWPRTSIRLPRLGLDVKIEIVPQILVWRNYRVEAPRFDFVLDEDGVAVRGLRGRLFGGDLEMSAWLKGRGRLTGGATATLREADAVVVLGGGGAYGVSSGRIEAEVELRSKGRSPLDLISNLAGRGRITLRDGVFRGFDLEAVNRRAGTRERQVGAIELFLAGRGGGETIISLAGGAFRIENGVIGSNNLLVAAAGGGLAIDGSIDLKDRKLDVRARISLAAVPQAPPLEVELLGPVEEPDTILRFDAFQKYLLRTTGRPETDAAPK